MDPVIAGSLIGGAVSLGGGLLGASAQQSAQRSAQDFAERMSSTAHQREVADLRAAGLNPILSAMHGGASSPVVPAMDPSGPIGDAAKGVAHNVRMSQLDKSQVALNSAAEEAKRSEVDLNAAAARRHDAETNLTTPLIEKAALEADQVRKLTPENVERVRAETDLFRRNADLSIANAVRTRREATNIGLKSPWELIKARFAGAGNEFVNRLNEFGGGPVLRLKPPSEVEAGTAFGGVNSAMGLRPLK